MHIYVYIDRMEEISGMKLQHKNWRRILLGALVIASKVWEDECVWIEDFKGVFPTLSIEDLSQLERNFLNVLEFRLSIKPSEYAKYYFMLRSHLKKDIQEKITPLIESQLKRMEKRFQELSQRQLRKSSSEIFSKS